MSDRLQPAPAPSSSIVMTAPSASPSTPGSRSATVTLMFCRVARWLVDRPDFRNAIVATSTTVVRFALLMAVGFAATTGFPSANSAASSGATAGSPVADSAMSIPGIANPSNGATLSRNVSVINPSPLASSAIEKTSEVNTPSPITPTV